MTTKGTMLKCLRCGWEWAQRFDRTPVECPACKRRNWREQTAEDIISQIDNAFTIARKFGKD